VGEIVGAGIVAHVPTIMLPEEVRLEINDGREITLVPGLQRLRSEVHRDP
jgi:3,4-dihydroxyphenylacetate 2,3-dioxygenase